MPKATYTVRCFLTREDGKTVPFENLAEEEKSEVFSKMSERLGENMSRYFNQHPSEYESLMKGSEAV